MANLTELNGLCPPPFLQESRFPIDGGYLQGRFCASLESTGDGPQCCLPCPTTDWIYPDNFYDMTRVAGYINCIALAMCVFMLVSLAFLPAKTTKRHYLNVCLLSGAIAFHLGFVVPWAAKPDPCFNKITPNNESSNWACAWGGALIVFGGVSLNVWILIRALSMHLQICWNILTGQWFFWISLVAGLAVSGTLLTTELALSGVSMRFGDYCHVNYESSLASLWGPLLGLSAVSISLQFATLAYCLQVYMKTLLIRSTIVDDRKMSTGALSATHSLSSEQARAVFARVRKVVMWVSNCFEKPEGLRLTIFGRLQWRGLIIAIILVADVVFFSVIFVVLNAEQQANMHDHVKLAPWIACLIKLGDKEQCRPLAKGLSIEPNLLIATLVLLSLVGIEVSVLLCRLEIFTSWYEVITAPIKRRRAPREFVSLDAMARGPHLGRGSHWSAESIALTSLLPTQQPRSKSPFVTELTRIERTDYRRTEEYRR